MTERIVRPTAKFIKAGAILAAIVVLGLEIAYLAKWRHNEALTWVPIVAPLVLLWPARRAGDFQGRTAPANAEWNVRR